MLVLLAIACTATACGDAFTPPAAVVDGREIPQATLERQLRLVLADPQFAAQGEQTAQERRDLTRELLGFLIQRSVIRSYAESQGISVSSEELESRLDQIIEQTGGQAAFERELQQRGLTEEEVRANIEQGVLIEKVRAMVAKDAGASEEDTAAADQAFSVWLQERLRSTRIRINPRFGRFDPGTGQVLPIDSTELLG